MSTSATLWIWGLEPEDARRVRETAGEGYDCRPVDDAGGNLAALLKRAEREDPLLLWMSNRARQALLAKDPDMARMLRLLPTVLVLEADPGREALEQALDARVQQVLRSPLDETRVFDALSRAREAQNVYLDMERLTREVMMGREILGRKTDVCAFLFRFFSAVGSAPDARALMDGCADALKDFCGVESVHAVWWGDGTRLEYLDAGRDSASVGSWRDFLRERAVAVRPDSGAASSAHGPATGAATAPDSVPGHALLLPLALHDRACGLVALQLREERLPSRDMSQALDAACRHLALSLRERAGQEGFFAPSGENGTETARPHAVHH